MYNVYQEYINSIFHTDLNYNRLEQTNFENTVNTNQLFQNSINNQNIEKFYPELYKLIYPMIQNACMKNTNELSEETINNIVKEIYSNFVSDDNNNDEFRSGKSSEAVSVVKSKNFTSINSKKSETIPEKSEIKQDNYVLRDLIKILVLRELHGKPGVIRNGWQEALIRPYSIPTNYSLNNSIYETNFNY